VLRENYRFNAAALERMAAALNDQMESLCDRWKAIHGDF
jgi:hypothetical protein